MPLVTLKDCTVADAVDNVVDAVSEPSKHQTSEAGKGIRAPLTGFMGIFIIPNCFVSNLRNFV